MDTKLLIEQYLADGGTITQLPQGGAQGALDLGGTNAISEKKQPKALANWGIVDEYDGTNKNYEENTWNLR